MADRSLGFNITFDVDSAGAQRRVGEFVANMRKQIAAAIKSLPDIELKADSSDADRAIAKVRSELQTLGAKRIGIDISAEDAKKEIARLRAELVKIGAESASIQVKADTASAIAGLDAVDKKRKDLDGKTATVKVDIDKRKFADAANAWALLSRNMKTLAMPVGIAAAIPTILELSQAAGVASQSLLLLPAAGAAAGIVMGTVKLGVSGLGVAFKALAKGDMAKFGEDLKKLSPEAQNFAKAVAAAKPAFDLMKLDVQDALLRGFAGTVTDLASSYLPVLRAGFVGVATEINLAGRGIAAFVEQSQTINDVKTIFANTRDAMHALSPAGVAILQILRDIATVGSSFLPGLAAGFTKAAEGAARFVAAARESGKLHEWIAQGLDAVKLLGQTFINVGKIVAAVFRALHSDSNSFLTQIRDITGKVADFLNSARGQQELVKIFSALRGLAAGLAPLLGAIALAIVGMVEQLGPALPPLLQGITDVFNASGDLLGVFSQLLVAILPPLGKALSLLSPILGPLLVVITAIAAAMKIYAATVWLVNAATEAWAVVQAILDGTLLLNPIGLIVVALAALAAALVYAYNHSETFRKIVGGAWDWIKKAVQTAWGIIKPIFDAIGTALSDLGHFFSDLWTNWVKPAWDAISAATGGVVDDLKVKWQGFQDWIGPYWDAFAAFVSKFWTDLTTDIKDKWNAVWGYFQPAWQGFRDWIGSTWDAFGGYVAEAWDRFTADIAGKWNAVWGVLQPAWQGFLDFIGPAWDDFATKVSAWWTTITGYIKDDWNLVWGVLKPAWEGFRDWCKTEWDTWAPIVGAIWTAVTGQIKDAWEAVWVYIGPLWAGFRDYIGNEWNTVWKPYVQAYWDGIKAVIQADWETTWPILQAAWQGWVTYIYPEFAKFKTYTDQHWGGVKTSTTDQWLAIWPVLKVSWNEFAPWIHGQWDTFYAWFTGGWARMGTAIKDEWNRWPTAIANAFTTMAGNARTGANAIIDVLNRLIHSANSLLSHLNVPAIPDIPRLEAGGTVPTLASGGPMPVKSGFMTNGPVAVVGEGNRSHPEYVIPTDPKYRPRAVGLYRELGGQLMAGGGTLPARPSGTQYLAAGGIIGDVVGLLSGGVGGAVDAMVSAVRGMLPSQLLGDIGRGILDKVTGGLKSTIQKAWDAFQAALAALAAAAAGAVGGGGGGPGGPAPAGGSAAMQWIIAHESGGRNVKNPTSTASGYFQMINGTWKAYGGSTPTAMQASYAEQERVATNYVNSRFGGWGGAVAYWQAHGNYARGGILPVNQYDTGGMLPIGLSLAMNNTGRPELVSPVRGNDGGDLLAELRIQNGLLRSLRGDVDQSGSFDSLIGEVRGLRYQLAASGGSAAVSSQSARTQSVSGAWA